MFCRCQAQHRLPGRICLWETSATPRRERLPARECRNTPDEAIKHLFIHKNHFFQHSSLIAAIFFFFGAPLIAVNRSLFFFFSQLGSIRGASKYRESIHIHRLCIGYVSVILYAGREEKGTNGRILARDRQGMSKGWRWYKRGIREVSGRVVVGE